MDYTKIGMKIRAIREKELKITREKFAEEIGISNLTVARLENYTRKITNIEIYSKISCVTGYTIDELINNTELSDKNIKDKLYCLLNSLSDNELEYVYSYVRTLIKFIKKRN